MFFLPLLIAGVTAVAKAVAVGAVSGAAGYGVAKGLEALTKEKPASPAKDEPANNKDATFVPTAQATFANLDNPNEERVKKNAPGFVPAVQATFADPAKPGGVQKQPKSILTTTAPPAPATPLTSMASV